MLSSWWRVKVAGAAAAAVAAALALPDGAAAERTVYVANSDPATAGLAAFRAAEDGTLTALADTPIATGNEPHGIAVSPDARFAYVVQLQDSTVGTYRLSKSGKPTSADTTPTGGVSPTGIGITPNGEFLFVTNRDAFDLDPTVAAFAVDQDDGSLAPVPGSPFDVGIFDPRAPVVSPDGDHLYVNGRRGPSGPPASNADRALAVLTIGANGAPTPIAGSPFFSVPMNPFGAVISPDGGRLFMTALIPNDIEAFNLNPTTGAPTPVAGSPFNTGDSPLVLTMTPDGQRLYTGLAGPSESVEGFDINQGTGALTQIAGTPLGVGGDPQGITTSPNGNSVYTSLGTSAGQVAALGIGGSGSLSSLAGSPYPTGGIFPSFFSVAVTPTQTPRPKLSVKAPVAGKKTKFDASATEVRGGRAERFDWDFGDGTTIPDGGTSPKHTFTKPGTYDVTLTVTSDCDPDAVFVEGVSSVGNAVYCNGPREATLTKRVKVAKDKVDAKVSAKKKQAQEGSKVLVKVKVKARERLKAVASGKVKAAGQSFPLRKRVKTVKKGKTKKLKLKPKKGSQAQQILALLDMGEKTKAKLKVKLSDDVGNRKTKKLAVRLKR